MIKRLNSRNSSTLLYPISFFLAELILIHLSRNPPNVLPLVNKGLSLFQWKQDIGAAERCCNEALRIDPSCEAAVATLAQLYLQQSKIEKAVEMFSRQADLARSEPELINALTYQFVSFFILWCWVFFWITFFLLGGIMFLCVPGRPLICPSFNAFVSRFSVFTNGFYVARRRGY